MELKEAINNLNFIIVTDVYDNEVRIDKTKVVNEYNESVGVVLQHLAKQEKMIGNIFSYLDDHRIDDNICDEILNYGAKDCIHNGNCTECIKKYFEKKVEESE